MNIDNTDESIPKYVFGFQHFLELGVMLELTWKEIEQAYYTKNRKNHERQENGY